MTKKIVAGFLTAIISINAAAKSDSTAIKFSDRLHVISNGEAGISFVHHDNSYNNKDIFADFSLEIGYDMGQGWDLTTEASFSHTDEFTPEGSASRVSNDVLLEQLWIEKSFRPQLTLRLGWQEVPVGYANTYNDPDNFFGIYQPQAELATIPDSWKEVAVTLLGEADNWQYQVMYLAASKGNGIAARIDNTSVANLRMGLSGFYGDFLRETLSHEGITGHRSAIGCFDFTYSPDNTIIRSWTELQHQNEGNVLTAGGEAGYDIFSAFTPLRRANQKLYVFGHYDYCRASWTDYNETDFGRHHVSFGLNYFPVESIIIKSEYSVMTSSRRIPDRPSFNLAVAYVTDIL